MFDYMPILQDRKPDVQKRGNGRQKVGAVDVGVVSGCLWDRVSRSPTFVANCGVLRHRAELLPAGRGFVAGVGV